jgi:hypothetical protein
MQSNPTDARYRSAINRKVMVEGKGSDGSAVPAILLYYGPTSRSNGVKRCGVEFLQDGIGKHDGSVNGKRYFQCTRGRGALVSASAVLIESTRDLRKSTGDTDDDSPTKKKKKVGAAKRAAKRAAKASAMATNVQSTRRASLKESEAELLDRLASAKLARETARETARREVFASASLTAVDSADVALALANKDKELAKLRSQLEGSGRKKKRKKKAKGGGAKTMRVDGLIKAEESSQANVVAAQAVASKAREQEMAMMQRLDQMRRMVAEAERETELAMHRAEGEAERKRQAEKEKLIEAAMQRRAKEEMERAATDEIRVLAEKLEAAERAQRKAEQEAADHAAAVMAEEAEVCGGCSRSSPPYHQLRASFFNAFTC